MKILNSCFDDIEKFIARLQHSAAAFRELEKRRRSRKSKKKDLGDGMLSVRAKPPPEKEFVDIFQKCLEHRDTNSQSEGILYTHIHTSSSELFDLDQEHPRATPECERQLACCRPGGDISGCMLCCRPVAYVSLRSGLGKILKAGASIMTQ